VNDAQVITDTVTADVQDLAKDAQKKARSLTEEEEVRLAVHVSEPIFQGQSVSLDHPLQVPTGPKAIDCGITERLLAAVQSFSYASFADQEASAGEELSNLEPWQVQHAQAILSVCPELDSLRFALCPKCAPRCKHPACTR
jgi:hypothetical protein